jgi:selenium metabolism protein YedF
MASKSGYDVVVEEQGDEFRIHLARSTAQAAEEQRVGVDRSLAATGPLVLVVSASQMGRGPKELGEILMRAFFHTLGEVDPRPDTVIFFNEGVRLTAEGSPLLEDLEKLVESGVEILVCGTCLGFFDLKDKIAVGEVSNMYSIAETLLRAGKVITL